MARISAGFGHSNAVRRKLSCAEVGPAVLLGDLRRLERPAIPRAGSFIEHPRRPPPLRFRDHVEDLGAVGKGLEPVREPSRHVERACCQRNSTPNQRRKLGIRAQIDDDVQQRRRSADQLDLFVRGCWKCMPRSVPLRSLNERLHWAIRVSSPCSANSSRTKPWRRTLWILDRLQVDQVRPGEFRLSEDHLRPWFA